MYWSICVLTFYSLVSWLAILTLGHTELFVLDSVSPGLSVINTGRECRAVQDCPNCIPRARCININFIPGAADQACLVSGYQQAVLVENQFGGLPLRPQTCSSFGSSSCPLGSSCLRQRSSSSVCCYSQQFQTVGGKPGFCPAPGNVGVCGGRFCSVDTECPGELKCCGSPCGGRVCTYPSGGGQCGRCPIGTVCRESTVQCIRAPCPTVFRCVPLATGRRGGYLG